MQKKISVTIYNCFKKKKRRGSIITSVHPDRETWGLRRNKPKPR